MAVRIFFAEVYCTFGENYTNKILSEGIPCACPEGSRQEKPDAYLYAGTSYSKVVTLRVRRPGGGDGFRDSAKCLISYCKRNGNFISKI